MMSLNIIIILQYYLHNKLTWKKVLKDLKIKLITYMITVTDLNCYLYNMNTT